MATLTLQLLERQKQLIRATTAVSTLNESSPNHSDGHSPTCLHRRRFVLHAHFRKAFVIALIGGMDQLTFIMTTN